jgi:dihydrofolate synthase/folylpolyglutamate synthase
VSGTESREAGGSLAPERLDRPFGDPLIGRLFPPLATGVHWGLERTARALEALGDPQERQPSLHIGGTNGKGSVATTVAAVLEREGHRVGCFTSPHLCSFRERFVVGGRALTEDELIERAGEIRDSVIRFGLTFFEAVTVLGLHAFAKAGVDLAVLEVGLGGRLDATNVVRPLASAVTNVAMDHADYLGDTLAAIAREKAGIVKPGVPFLTAETDPELVELFRGVARSAGAPFYPVDPSRVVGDLAVDTVGTTFTLTTESWGQIAVHTPLVGRHQAANAALAVAMLEHLPDDLRPDVNAVKSGLERVVHPGRDQIETVNGTTWLFDVAHNTAGIESLVDTLDRLELPRPLVALVGVLGDKNWREMLPPLFRHTVGAVLTQAPSAPPERRWNPSEAAAAVDGSCPIHVEDDFAAATAVARELAGRGTVVVTGSVHTVGGALHVLGREPLATRREAMARG